MKTDYFEFGAGEDRIWCAADRAAEAAEDRPVVVITPGYERTSRDALTLARYLVLNGFDTVRFDARNSVGLSHGEMARYTLSGLANDIEAVLQRVRQSGRGPSRIAVLALSLSNRALIRCLARTPGLVSIAVSIVGVVDARHTIGKVAGEDVFGGFARGERYGTKKLLTQEIDWDHFIGDAIAAGLESLEGSIEEARRVSVGRWASIVTEKDEWTDARHQDRFLAALGGECRAERVVIEGAGHKIWKNPRTAHLSMLETIRILHEHFFQRSVSDAEISRPDMTEIVELNRAERRVTCGSGLAPAGFAEVTEC